jgi:UV DNA damage endonuclease
MSPARAQPGGQNRPSPARRGGSSLRLGLCCAFVEQPIRFRRTTARYVTGLRSGERHPFLRHIALDNAQALALAVDWCAAHGIGAFRVNSEILPVATHPQVGYRLDELEGTGEITKAFADAGAHAKRGGVRLSFHPDQFVVPGSSREDVTRSSLAELEHQASVAEIIGAEQLTLHGGGAQGGKPAALDRLRRNLARLSPRARERIALENDDRVYTVLDLLPLCREEGIPLVYDVHHHRCNPDGLSVEEATLEAARTWGKREPWAHLSSPKGGWRSDDPRQHADFIRPPDVPACWVGRRMTVDVEAKAKELAVLRLAEWLRTAGNGPILVRSRSRSHLSLDGFWFDRKARGTHYLPQSSAPHGHRGSADGAAESLAKPRTRNAWSAAYAETVSIM